MDSLLALIISVGIWLAELYSFAMYVKTKSDLWMSVCMVVMWISILLMKAGIMLIDKEDFRILSKQKKENLK